MKIDIQFTRSHLKLLTFILLSVTTSFNLFAQDAIMHSGKTLERKDFRDNASRYGDFLNNSGRLNASSVIFNPDHEAMVGFSSNRKDTYNFMVLKDYINFSEIRGTKAEVPEKTEAYLHAVVRINERNFVIYSHYSTGTKQTVVYVNEMSNDNVLLGSPIKLLTVGEDKNKIYDMPRVRISKNKKSILVYFPSDGSGKDTRKMLGFVMDQNFSQVWQNEFDFKLPEKESTINSVEIDDDGNFYALLYKGNEKRQKASVFSYFWKNKNLTETSIGNANEKAKTYGCLLKVVDGVSPVVAGVIDLSDELSYFVVSFDVEKNSSTELVSTNIPENVKSILINKRVDELYLGVQQIVKTTNNNFVISMEENHEMDHRSTSNTGTTSYTSYHSGGIFLVSVGSSGVTWSKTITKRQWTFNPFITGHTMIANGNNALVFYNDKSSNIGKEGKEVDDFKGANATTVMQTINPAGEMKSQQLDSEQGGSFGMNPNYFVKISDNLYHTQLLAIAFNKYACAYATIELK